jgi:hypothetical protein
VEIKVQHQSLIIRSAKGARRGWMRRFLECLPRVMMAKLGPETTEIINRLRQEAFDIVDEATALEFKIFDRFGETEQVLSYMDEIKNVSEEAIAFLSRLSTLQLHNPLLRLLC